MSVQTAFDQLRRRTRQLGERMSQQAQAGTEYVRERVPKTEQAQFGLIGFALLLLALVARWWQKKRM